MCWQHIFTNANCNQPVSTAPSYSRSFPGTNVKGMYQTKSVGNPSELLHRRIWHPSNHLLHAPSLAWGEKRYWHEKGMCTSPKKYRSVKFTFGSLLCGAGKAANPERFLHRIENALCSCDALCLCSATGVNVKLMTPQNSLQNAVRLQESDRMGGNTHAIRFWWGK